MVKMTIEMKLVLEIARTLIIQGFCTHAVAADKEGNALYDPMDEAAVAWDPRGAIDAAIMRRYGTFDADDFTRVEQRAMTMLVCGVIWNGHKVYTDTSPGFPKFIYDIERWVDDHHSVAQEDVVFAFDKAIEFVGDETMEVAL